MEPTSPFGECHFEAPKLEHNPLTTAGALPLLINLIRTEAAAGAAPAAGAAAGAVGVGGAVPTLAVLLHALRALLQHGLTARLPLMPPSRGATPVVSAPGSTTSSMPGSTSQSTPGSTLRSDPGWCPAKEARRLGATAALSAVLLSSRPNCFATMEAALALDAIAALG